MMIIDDRFDEGRPAAIDRGAIAEAALPGIERGDGDVAVLAVAVYREARGREVGDESGPAGLSWIHAASVAAAESRWKMAFAERTPSVSLPMLCSGECRVRFIESLRSPTGACRDSHNGRIRFWGAGQLVETLMMGGSDFGEQVRTAPYRPDSVVRLRPPTDRTALVERW